MKPIRRYEVVETWHGAIAGICGLPPIVRVTACRWKWLAHIKAHFASHGGICGVNVANVRVARPKLTVIDGGRSQQATHEQ